MNYTMTKKRHAGATTKGRAWALLIDTLIEEMARLPAHLAHLKSDMRRLLDAAERARGNIHASPGIVPRDGRVFLWVYVPGMGSLPSLSIPLTQAWRTAMRSMPEREPVGTCEDFWP